MLMTLTMSETLGKRLRRLRRSAGMTQEDLARAAGVKLSALRNWEQDKRVPLADSIAPLARALKVTTDELLGVSTED